MMVIFTKINMIVRSRRLFTTQPCNMLLKTTHTHTPESSELGRGKRYATHGLSEFWCVLLPSDLLRSMENLYHLHSSQPRYPRRLAIGDTVGMAKYGKRGIPVIFMEEMGIKQDQQTYFEHHKFELTDVASMGPRGGSTHVLILSLMRAIRKFLFAGCDVWRSRGW